MRTPTSPRSCRVIALVALLATSLAVGIVGARREPPCDLLFTGGRVVDGTGAPWFRADVCVSGGPDRRDRARPVGARRRRGASTRPASSWRPGFIDMLGQSEYLVLVDGRAASKITQGITTEITGEGDSIAPIDARMIADGRATYEHYGVTPNWTTLDGYFREFERRGAAINLGTFVGAGGVRDLVVGQDDRPATARELDAMKAAVAAGHGARRARPVELADLRARADSRPRRS